MELWVRWAKIAHIDILIKKGKIYGSFFYYQINNLAKEFVAGIRLHLRRWCKDFNKQLKKHCTNEKPCPPQENKTYWYLTPLYFQRDGERQWSSFWILLYIKHNN
jgi:hypothetical protein